MKAFCYEVTKVIVVTVEAGSGPEASASLEADLADGEYAYSWERADPQVKLLDVEELK